MTTIQEGKKAPAFTLPSSEGGKTKLSEHAGKYVVLYFYPKDDTPGCTTEAKDFQAALPKLAKLDAVVLGVSKDPIEKHLKFKTKHGLLFPLLTDEDGAVLEKYGAWGEKVLYGKKSLGVIRSTVIVDPAGKVAHHWKKVQAKGHAAKVAEKIKELRGAATR
ncbi:MAG: peroxiredoxin [Myxococcales bacterium]|nr:peroxiredoxin [Myxococcales bacterium]